MLKLLFEELSVWDAAAQGKALVSMQDAWEQAMLVLEAEISCAFRNLSIMKTVLHVPCHLESLQAFPANVQSFTAGLCSIPGGSWLAAVCMLEPLPAACLKGVPSLVTYNAAMDVCDLVDPTYSFMLRILKNLMQPPTLMGWSMIKDRNMDDVG